MGTLGDRDLVGRKYGKYWLYYSRAPFSFGALPRFSRRGRDLSLTWRSHEIGMWIVP